MPYFLVDNFNGGMDVRRNTASPAGGTVREIRNAFVNRGGEIERRRKWYELEKLTTNNRLAANQQRTIGPIKSFRADGVYFLTHTEPGVDADWTAVGNGVEDQDNNYFFGVYGMGSTAPAVEDFNRVLSTSFFTDQMIVSYSNVQTTSNSVTATLDVNFSSNVSVPDTAVAIAGVDGGFPSGAAAVLGDHLSKFTTLFGVGPNNFTLRKHVTDAPETVTGTGAGTFDIRGQGSAVGRPLAITEYFSQVALFCEYGVQFWSVDPDPALFSYGRSIEGESVRGIRTVNGYTNGDVIYMSNTGIRSLRARDSSNFAVSTDVGSPIDSIILEKQKAHPYLPLLAISEVHYGLGQVWFFLGSEVYVLSDYRGSGIAAWAVFDLPDHDDAKEYAAYVLDASNNANGWAMDVARLGETICLRMGTEEVFTYGVTDVDSAIHYDSTYTTTVLTHYFGVQDPFTDKVFNSVDVTASGTWTIEYSLDPENETWVEIYSGDGLTHGLADIKIDMTAQLIAFRLTTTSASAASLSQIAVHYDKTEDQG